jgi:hypothetical protein
MHRCAQSDDVRAALANDLHLSDELGTHVASCPECSGIHAEARRFAARLEAATAELITDALPPNTSAIARAAPSAVRRRASAGVLLGTLASATLVVFAAVGVVVTGVSLADSLQGRQGGGPDTGGEPETLDCSLGDPTIEITAEDLGMTGGSGAVIAYCFGEVVDATVDEARAISCARSIAAGQEARREAEAAGISRPGTVDLTYLGACTRVVDVEVHGPDPEAGASTGAGSSVPLVTWERADGAASWQLLQPRWLPEGYELAALQGFGSRGEDESIAAVSATYLRAGSAVIIEQFLLPESDGFRIELSIPEDQLDGVSTGQTTVGEHAAFWADGMVATSGGAGFDVDHLVLTWAHDGIGYRITARFDDLDVLRRIGESLTGG